MQFIQRITWVSAVWLILGLFSFVQAHPLPGSYHPDQAYTLRASYYPDYGENMGTDIALTVMNGYEFLSDHTWKDVPGISPLLDFLVASHIALINHEITGHALRTKQLGGTVEGIKIGFFEGAVTTSGITDSQKLASVSMAGIDASRLLAGQISDRAVGRNHLSKFSAMTYLLTSLDQINYIYWNTKKSPGHDIDNYVQQINAFYGGTPLSRKKMRSIAWMSALDPMLYYALYTVVTQKTDMTVPMIPMGGTWKWLPALSAAFTPYGYERILKNYIKHGDFLGTVSLGTGKSYKNNKNTFLIAFDTSNLFKVGDTSTVGVSLAYWRQPRVYADTPAQEKMTDGGLAAINWSTQFNETFGMDIQLGYKTEGYILGQVSGKGLVLGITGRIHY